MDNMKKRLFAIDAVRGWVMILMALDHAMLFCYNAISAEGYQGMRPQPMPDIAHYLTRFITHYCASSFFFLAGLSVAFYSLSRRSQLFSEREISRNLLTRGFLLIALQITVVNWTWGIYPLRTYFGVLSCIGSGMVILAFARRLPVPLLAGGSTFLLLLVPFLLAAFPPMPGTDQPLLEIALQPNFNGWLRVLYPLLPWLGVMGLGCACGYWVATDTRNMTKFFFTLGLLLLVGWLVLRLGCGYGNLTPYQGGDWRDFMLMSKYPPSLVFLMWTLGGMAIAIAGHNYLEARLPFTPFWGLVILFGQTPLFFYVVHLVLYKSFNLIPFLNSSLAGGYLAWFLGLGLMVPLCAGYRSLKKRYPRSVLQYV